MRLPILATIWRGAYLGVSIPGADPENFSRGVQP